MTNLIVMDTESDGLAYDCSKLHIMSWTKDGSEVFHTDSYDDMRDIYHQEGTRLVCHNAIRHDAVVFERLLGIPVDFTKWVDTLSLSWFLWPDRKLHGLGSFTKESGVDKPSVEDWTDVTWEQMKERCGNDVLINWWVWKQQEKRLDEIYG